MQCQGRRTDWVYGSWKGERESPSDHGMRAEALFLVSSATAAIRGHRWSRSVLVRGIVKRVPLTSFWVLLLRTDKCQTIRKDG
jgi:hypothetical protein